MFMVRLLSLFGMRNEFAQAGHPYCQPIKLLAGLPLVWRGRDKCGAVPGPLRNQMPADFYLCVWQASLVAILLDRK